MRSPLNIANALDKAESFASTFYEGKRFRYFVGAMLALIVIMFIYAAHTLQ